MTGLFPDVMTAISPQLEASPVSPRTLLCGVMVVIAALATMWPVRSAQFVDFDDYHTITRNPDLLHPTTDSLRRLWREPRMDLYVPVTYTVWWAIAHDAPRDSVTGSVRLEPRSYHSANLAIHAATALVAFALLRRLLHRDWPAALGATLFAVHPLQVESVAWASGFKDVLGGLLCLAALWQFTAFAQATGWARIVHYAAALLAMAIGTLAKPIAMAVPGMLLAVDLLVLRRPWRSAAIAIAPFALLGLACAIWTARLQTAPHLDTTVSVALRPLVAMDAIAFYLYKIVLPLDLAHDYGRTPAAVMGGRTVGFIWIIPVVLFTILWFYRRRRPELLAAGALFTVPLIPVLGLIPFDFQAYSTVADHYFYLPMAGVGLAAAVAVAGLSHLSSKMRVTGTIGVLVLLGCLGTLSHAQSKQWLDNDALLSNALRVNPRSWSANGSLASLAMERRDYVSAEQYARRSVEAKPTYLDSRINLGAALVALKRPAEGLEHLEAAVRLKPDSPEAQANLGSAYASMGRIDDAIAAWEAALRADPGFTAVEPILARARDYREMQRRSRQRP